MACFACRGLTDNARRTGQITDQEIWRFVLGTYYYRDGPDFPYEAWPETGPAGQSAYFPEEEIQTTVAQLFRISDWRPAPHPAWYLR